MSQIQQPGYRQSQGFDNHNQSNVQEYQDEKNSFGFREKLVARLGNAQLSDSKQYDSYGVEEQENEDASSIKNSEYSGM